MSNTHTGVAQYTIKRLLLPLLGHPKASQLIKYIVYLSLVVNFGFYLVDDIESHIASLADDVPWSEIFTTYATTIDGIAWLGLVFLFELDTYALPDEAYKKWIIRFIRGARMFCYVSIAYAAYGYTAETLENYQVTEIQGLEDLCTLSADERYIQLSVTEYEKITSSNCTQLSTQDTYFRIADETSVIDEPTLSHIQWLGWIDVLNAFVWLIVVLLIDIEVRLQDKDRFSGGVLQSIRVSKTFFYLVLIGNGIIWIFTGYGLYGWDAFLWIFGFWAIELNLAEWERDRTLELSQQRPPTSV